MLILYNLLTIFVRIDVCVNRLQMFYDIWDIRENFLRNITRHIAERSYTRVDRNKFRCEEVVFSAFWRNARISGGNTGDAGSIFINFNFYLIYFIQRFYY